MGCYPAQLRAGPAFRIVLGKSAIANTITPARRTDENLFPNWPITPHDHSYRGDDKRGLLMRKSQRRVLLALGWYDYRLHRGIEKFAQEHGWYLSANLTREKVIPWGWEGDGILAWLGAGDDLAERSEE